MKKLIFIICIFIMLFSGCSKEKEAVVDIKKLTASDFLSKEEVSNYINYTPVAEESQTSLCKKVKYSSSDSNAADPVEVLVYSENEKKTKDNLKADFDYQKQKNSEYGSLIQTDDLDADAFISIPSVHIYKEGYYIVITAGSGGGEEQINLLKNLAGVVIENINNLISKK